MLSAFLNKMTYDHNRCTSSSSSSTGPGLALWLRLNRCFEKVRVRVRVRARLGLGSRGGDLSRDCERTLFATFRVRVRVLGLRLGLEIRFDRELESEVG